MRICSLICTFVLLLCTIGHAAESVSLPNDVPPAVGTAVATGIGDDIQIKLAVPSARWRVVGEVVPKSKWPELKVDMAIEKRTLLLGGPSQLAPSRVVDVKGTDLSSEQILEQLKKESPVLVSVSGKPVDPYYLQLTQPDALIVILGARDKMPAPMMLPGRAPEPTTVRYRPPMQEETPHWRSVLVRGSSRLRGVLGVGDRNR
jgi:hypothetical protein